MADPFVAEIRIFPLNFAPKGWAFCNGQLLPISQYTALFSLLGTNYGGDGKVTFALPNMEGSAPMQPGQGQGLTSHFLGETGGTDTVTLLESEMPSHNHDVLAANFNASDNLPTSNDLARGAGGLNAYAPPGTIVNMSLNALTPTGGSQPHKNLQPYLTVNYCIALQGIFPPRD